MTRTAIGVSTEFGTASERILGTFTILTPYQQYELILNSFDAFRGMATGL